MKLAPTVEVSWEGWKAPLQYRMTRDVLPTPWEPSTTILASRADDMATSLCMRAEVRYQAGWTRFLAIARDVPPGSDDTLKLWRSCTQGLLMLLLLLNFCR